MRLEITIPDPLFDGAQRSAAARGLSFEAFVTDALELRLQADPEDDMSWFFTPERLAEIDVAAAEADQGGSLTMDEVMGQLAEKSRQWRENHPA